MRPVRQLLEPGDCWATAPTISLQRGEAPHRSRSAVQVGDFQNPGCLLNSHIDRISVSPLWAQLVGQFRELQIAQLLAQDLDDAQVLDVCDKIISYYRGLDTKKRMGRIISGMGIDAFRNEIGI